MSIIRNSRSSTNKTVTIKRFLSTATDSIESGSGKTYDHINLNNVYFFPTDSSRYSLYLTNKCTIIMKCMLYPNITNNSVLMGTKADGGTNHNGLRIEIINNIIYWYNRVSGSDTEMHHQSVEGSSIHNIGFVYEKDGSTDKMYAYYDGKKGTAATNITACLFLPLIASKMTGTKIIGNPLRGSGIAIALYEIAGVLSTGASNTPSDSLLTDIHYYITGSGTTHYLYETRGDSSYSKLQTTAGSSGSIVDVLGSAVTYGVQLHDLKYAFSSPYKDLMAIVCQDNGSPATEADPADILTNGSVTHAMAFRMADGTNTTPSDAVPLPSGYYVSRSGTYKYTNYEKGELIYNRRPKWNIWADNNKFGFWIYDPTPGVAPVMRYNVFRDYNGLKPNGNKIELLKFDGYSTSSGASHEPLISPPTSILVEMHNDMHCKCGTAQLMAGDPTKHYNEDSSQPLIQDQDLVYFYEQGASGSVGYRAGNLPPWNYAMSELESNCYVYGVSVKAGFGSGYELFAATDYVSTALSSATDSTTKAHFRTATQNANFQVLPGRISLVVNEWSRGNLDVKVEMGLLAAATSSPTAADIIDCSKFCPAQYTSFNIANDVYINGGTNYRLIVKDDSTIRPAIVIGAGYYTNRRYCVYTKYEWVSSGASNVFSSRLIVPFIATNSSGQPTLLTGGSRAETGDFYGIAEVAALYLIDNRLVRRHNIAYTYTKNMEYLVGDATQHIAAETTAFNPALEYWGREPVNDSTQPNKPNFPRYNKFYQRGSSAATELVEWNNAGGSLNYVGDVTKYTNFLIVDTQDLKKTLPIGDDATAMICFYQESSAPVVCNLNGNWDSATQTPYDEFGSYAVQLPTSYTVSDPTTLSTYICSVYANMYTLSSSTHHIARFEIKSGNTVVDTVDVDFGTIASGIEPRRAGSAYSLLGYSFVCTRIVTDSTISVHVYYKGMDVTTYTMYDSTSASAALIPVSGTPYTVEGSVIEVTRTDYTLRTDMAYFDGIKMRLYLFEEDMPATDPQTQEPYPCLSRTLLCTMTLSEYNGHLYGQGSYGDIVYNVDIQYMTEAEYAGYFMGLDGNASTRGFSNIRITRTQPFDQYDNYGHGLHYEFEFTT